MCLKTKSQIQLTNTGIKISDPYTNKAPKKNPILTGTNVYSPSVPYNFDETAISIAGANRDQYDAAVITCKVNDKRTIMDNTTKTNFQ